MSSGEISHSHDTSHFGKGSRFSWVKKLMNNGKAGSVGAPIRPSVQRCNVQKLTPRTAETVSIPDSSASIRSIKSGRASRGQSMSGSYAASRYGAQNNGTESVLSSGNVSMASEAPTSDTGVSDGVSTRAIVSPRESNDEYDNPQSFTAESSTGASKSPVLNIPSSNSGTINTPGNSTTNLGAGNFSTPADAASVVTLASSTRNLRRRRSVDTYASTNASTTAIPPASIMERITGTTTPTTEDNTSLAGSYAVNSEQGSI